MTTTLRTALVLGGATLLVAASASVASADAVSPPPPVSGCPAAAQVLSVEALGDGYKVPSALDDPLNGGNGNGLVCGIEFNPRAALQIFGPTTCVANAGRFLFSDDALTAAH